LVSSFGAPDLNSSTSAIDHLSAKQFLKYSANTYVVRAADNAALNAADSDTGTAVQIANRDAFDGATLTGDFFAKYAGEAGNSLKISICAADATDFASWAYKGSFDAAPGTSNYVAERSADSSGALDECHVVVLDADGTFTGQRDGVLETFPNLSLATDARTDDGLKNYILDALTERSRYIYGAGHPAIGDITTTGVTAANFLAATHGGSTNGTLIRTINFKNGANSSTLDAADYETGFAQFADENTIQVDFLIAPGVATNTEQAEIVNNLVVIAESRKDCVVVTSPNRAAVIGAAASTSAITTCVASFSKSSYLIVDNNYLKVYDKYNDKYEFIPASSSTAGLMANTDDVAAPWFSPAGGRRGRYLGVTSLAYNPSKTDRDVLYKADINPIVNLPGQGVVLFGDKTFLGKPSAFNRINVRRLFLVMERAIKGAAQNVLFEFNDEFSRAEFVGIIEPFLRDIQGRRGISEFRVVCDETNNTPDIIDSNSFIASVFVKPARSVNFVTLNFVAVRTGVDFEEVLGVV
jgi:phage tail sheath protein FI